MSHLILIVSKVAASQRQFGPDGDALTPSPEVRAGALAIFAVLGIPFIHMLTTIFWFLNYSIQVTYSIPFALASIFSAGSKAGKGKISSKLVSTLKCVNCNCLSALINASFDLNLLNIHLQMLKPCTFHSLQLHDTKSRPVSYLIQETL